MLLSKSTLPTVRRISIVDGMVEAESRQDGCKKISNTGSCAVCARLVVNPLMIQGLRVFDGVRDKSEFTQIFSRGIRVLIFLFTSASGTNYKFRLHPEASDVKLGPLTKGSYISENTEPPAQRAMQDAIYFLRERVAVMLSTVRYLRPPAR